MALESVLSIKTLVIKKLYLHQMKAKRNTQTPAWLNLVGYRMNLLPRQMSIWRRKQTESEMKQTKKTFRYRQAKENFKFICERIADQKRFFCNVIYSDWGIFVKLLGCSCPTEQDSAPISAFTELTVFSSSARCKHSNIVPI